MDTLVFDAVILAGGRGKRLGVESKPLCTVGGRTLLDRAIASAAGAASVTISGPELAVESSTEVVFIQDKPQHGGPVAGLQAVAAAGRLVAPWTLVLACDVPGARAGVVELLTKASASEPAPSPVNGYCLVDEAGFVQWLFGLYRTSALVDRLERADRDQSMRSVVADLQLHTIPATNQVTSDVDTPADREAWDEVLSSRRHRNSSTRDVSCQPAVTADFTTFRFFAAAADAAGADQIELVTPTISEGLAELEKTRGAQFRSVVEQCSILADGLRVTDPHMSLTGVDVVDVLPPFCGG